MIDLQQALKDFRNAHPRSPSRQESIQKLCCQELQRHGISGAKIEQTISGAYRDKKWDVALVKDGEPQLAISCKSIVSNHGGTVPNRIDDMLGEAANIHRRWPNTVIAWLFIMSKVDESVKVQAETKRLGGMSQKRALYLEKNGDRWIKELAASVGKASDRKQSTDPAEKFELVSCSQIDFRQDPYKIVVPKGSIGFEELIESAAKIHSLRFQ